MTFLSRFGGGASPQSGAIDVIAPGAMVADETADVGHSADDNASDRSVQRRVLDAKMRFHRQLIEELNLAAVEKASRTELHAIVADVVSRSTLEDRLPLNAGEVAALVDELIDEMTGLGPIEPLLKDPTINDILINSH